MCSIVSASNYNRFQKIRDINLYRGASTSSVAVFDFVGDAPLVRMRTSIKGVGIVDIDIDERPGQLLIGHTQAPTSPSSGIHPATIHDAKLWHNGIVKQKIVGESWDTMEILKTVLTKGFKALSEIDGTFACVLFMDSNLYVFRNDLSPLYMNPNGSGELSSTIIPGSHEMLAYTVPANTVFRMEYNATTGKFSLVYVTDFKTKHNPYFF